MSEFAFGRSTAALLFMSLSLCAVGCGRMALAPTGGQPITLSPQQQQVLAQQTQQHQQRAADLDRDNQELQSLLAQSRQKAQLMEEQVRATQSLLRERAEQLAALQSNNEQLRTRTTAMAASIQQRSGAEIRANNSLLRNLTIANLPGVEVRQDGDVIRVEVPAAQFFNPGTAQIKYGAEELIRSIGADLMRNYPQQMIGVEGYTGANPPATPQFPSPQHLSVAQATAVYDALVRSAGVPVRQLFVVGHGSNHPLVSNATAAGQARNHRVELVVYPETVAR